MIRATLSTCVLLAACSSCALRVHAFFTCDAGGVAQTESASRASEAAFSKLRDNRWFRETGKLAFTHDVNQEEDGSAYGYPGGMIYARPVFANGLSPIFRLGGAPVHSHKYMLWCHIPWRQ